MRSRTNPQRTLLAALVAVATVGCGNSSSDGEPEADAYNPCSEAGGSNGEAADPPTDAGHYDPVLFGAGEAATNELYPLRPGTKLFYRGSSVEDGERLHHTVEIVVTDLVKVVDGVPNRVVWERDYTEGELVETELALFATDRHGNVWHMGEYPEEYEEGELVGNPAWVHGLAGACAGITIPGEPQTGTPGYAQGYAPPPIEWVDRGRVYKTADRTCVPAGCYDGVAVIEESEYGVPDAFQDKHYAPGVGVVRVGWRGDADESKEVLELVRFTRLTPARLAALRAEALELEERAYTTSKDVWGRTERADRGQ
jgi:hypothetical protein